MALSRGTGGSNLSSSRGESYKPAGRARQAPEGDFASTIQTGEFLVNLDTRVVSVDGKRVHPTGKEYGILELLSLRKGLTVTKEMFLSHLYAGRDEPEIKIVDVFVCKLRQKLAQATGGKHYIETVWGRGHVLRDPTAISGETNVVGQKILVRGGVRAAERVRLPAKFPAQLVRGTTRLVSVHKP